MEGARRVHLTHALCASQLTLTKIFHYVCTLNTVPVFLFALVFFFSLNYYYLGSNCLSRLMVLIISALCCDWRTYLLLFNVY